MLARSKAAGTTCALVLGLLAALPASAQHHRDAGPHIGFHLSVPLYTPYHYYPYYYPPAYPGYPPIVYPQLVYPPPVYSERGDVPSAIAPAAPEWFFCPEWNAYYPYVRSCPSAWRRVPALPPSSSRLGPQS